MVSYNVVSSPANTLASTAVWSIVSLILSIVGAIVVYFLFVKSDKKQPNNFLVWLKSFLNFDSMFIESILKILYIFFALFITLLSFGFIGISFLNFIMILTLGNIVVRVFYELIMIQICIWQNTRDINKKMK